MKKRWTVLVVVLVTCLLFAFAAVGCGNNDKKPNPPDNPGIETPGGDNPGGDKPGGDDNQGGNPGGDEEDPDPTDPVISFGEGVSRKLTAAVGETIDLPIASAVDELEGDLSADIWLEADFKNKYATITVDEEATDGKVHATFVSYTAGTHMVSYLVENSYGLSDSTYVNVEVTAQNPDVAVQHGDLSELEGGGIYEENFADFKSDFVREINNAQVVATADAIEGNSLVLDYGKGGQNIIQTLAIAPYFKTGMWKFSFDVKLVDGTPSAAFWDDFYVGYHSISSPPTFEANAQIGTLAPAVKNLTAGGAAVRVQFDCGLIEVPATETGGYFQIFCSPEDGRYKVKYAFDNFRIEYIERNVTTHRLTHADLIAADDMTVTYDFNDLYTSVGASEPVLVSEIEDSAAKTAISGADAGMFGDMVMELSAAASDHSIMAFDTNTFEKGYKYTVSFTYFTSETQAHYFIVKRIGVNNTTLDSNFMTPDRVGTYEISFEYKEADGPIDTLTIYGNIHAYVGRITVKAEELSVVPGEFVVDACNTSVTPEAILASGHTYDQSAGNYASVGIFYKIAELADGDMKTALTGAQGFGESVWQIKVAKGDASTYISALDGKFVKGYTYTVEFYSYVESYTEGVALITTDAGNVEAKIERTQVSGKIYKYTIVYPAGAFNRLMLYPQSAWEIYVGNVKVTAEETPYSEFPPEPATPSPSMQQWSPLANVGDKLTVDFSDSTFSNFSAGNNFFPTQLPDDNYVLYCSQGVTHIFSVSGSSAETSLLQNGRSYSITFKYKTDVAISFYFGYTPNGSGTQFGTSASLTVSDEWQTATVTFTVNEETAAQTHLTIYYGTAANILIDDIVIECTAIV